MDYEGIPEKPDFIVGAQNAAFTGLIAAYNIVLQE